MPGIETPSNADTETEIMNKTHPLEAAINGSTVRKPEVIYDDPENEMAVMIEQNGCQVTVKWFKQLVTSGRPTNDETLTVYLETI